VQVGSTIGQYRVLRKIGEGGMGVVFVGEHVLIGRKAAIKVLKPEISKHRRTIERFFNEARATAAIQDRGIAQLFDVGITRNKRAYIVMELLDGESLDVRLQRVGTAAPGDALRIVRQVAGTLTVVHAAGIVHRDLKPANLFSVVDPAALGGEQIKILDFGVAKLGPDLSDAAQTHAGAIMGTPLYMSPEQCSGSVVDLRTDIYSLGCVLFRLLTGRPPFALQGAGPVIAAHLTEPPPPPSRFVPQLPPPLDELVLRCLAKSRADRFPTMARLAEECDRLLAALAGEQPQTAIPSLPEATTVPLDVQPTTLGSMAGEKSPSTGPQRKWIGAAVAAGVFAGCMATVALARCGNDDRAAAPSLPSPPAQLGAAVPPIHAPEPTADAIDAAVAPEPTHELASEPPVPAVAKPAKAVPAAATPPVARPPLAKPPLVTKPRAKPRPPEHKDNLYDDRN